MFIKSLSIKNYRNFSDPPFKIELKPFTLILGENNVGKTNLLCALALIFSQEMSIHRKRLLEIEDINFQAIEKFKKDMFDLEISSDHIIFPEVKIDVEMVGLNKDQTSAAGDWPSPGNQNLDSFFVSYMFAPRNGFNKAAWVEEIRERVEETAITEKRYVVDFPIGEYRYSIFGSDDPSQSCDLYWLNMFKMDLLGALRDTERELVASGNNRLLYRILNQKDQTKYSDIKSILDDLNTKVTKNSNLRIIQEEVEKLLNKVSLANANLDNSVNFRFASPETSEILKKLSLLYGSNPVDVSRNGLGRNNLLYLSLLLSHLAEKDVWNNEAVVFRLIGIEEPEAHLHPHLQDHLAKNIETIQTEYAENMQLILTSHSTHIAAKMEIENTVAMFLDAETGNVDSHYILSELDSSKEKRSIHYLKKYLDATKSRMFFARKIILVEGISEQLLLPIFLEKTYDQTLEEIGCNIINVNGVAFEHFLKVISGGFFIKCLVVTDSDQGTQSSERATKLQNKYRDNSNISIQISENSTFEKDLISSNLSGSGKKVLESALLATRPKSGKDCINTSWSTDDFFNLISEYKSEFAFNLAEKLQETKNNFVLPDYIKKGLTFITE